MKKHSLLGSLFLVILAACSPKNTTNDLNAIDIAGSFANPTELKVSQLGKNIRYVPLETTDSSLIGNSHNIRLLDDKIAVSTNGRCLLFDKQTGKFIRSIGHKGEDPKGYSNSNCYVNPQTGVLYFIRYPNKLVKYDQEDNFLGEVILPQSLSRSFYFTFKDSLLLAQYDEGINQPQVSPLLWLNEKGEIKDSIPEFAKPGDEIGMEQILKINVYRRIAGKATVGGILYADYQNGKAVAIPAECPTLWQSDGQIRFRQPFNDTIYNIVGPEAKIHTVFHTGQMHFPAEKKGEKEGTNAYLVVTYLMETPQCVFFTCLKDLYDKKEAFYGVYDKESGNTYMNDAQSGLTDDLAHFAPFYPETSTVQGEYASLMEIRDVEEWVEANPDVPQDGKLSFLKQLNEDSNPVCVIVEP
ncbi:DUF4934 domain-containing protein [Phocaeicola sp.]